METIEKVKNKIKSEIRTITPSIAKDMLKRNANNRKLTETHSDFLAREMTVGNWIFDGQPIRFSEGGTLLDGQHRLDAVIKSNTEQQFLIIKGVESKAFKVMDTGRSRTSADVFSIHGITNACAAAAITRLIMRFDLGLNYDSAKTKLSNTMVLDYYKNHEDIGDTVSTNRAFHKAFDSILPNALLGSLRYLTSKKNITDSEDFWRKVCYGLALEKNCPTNILRKKLISDKINTASLPSLDKTAIIIKAWNAYRKGEKRQYLKWDKNSEKFPEII